MPPPLEIVSEDAAAAALADAGADQGPFHPFGAATLWWMAVRDRAQMTVALERLTYNPEAWGDFSDAEATISGYSIASFVDYLEGHQDEIAYVKFVPATEHSTQAFGDVKLDDVVVLTLRKSDDGWWRVWAISHNDRPGVDEIFGDG
jgi:hypothetical protein